MTVNISPGECSIDDTTTSGISLDGEYDDAILDHPNFTVLPDGTIQSSSTPTINRVEVTQDYTTTEEDELLGIKSGNGAITVTLDSNSLVDGHKKTINDEDGSADTNNITIESSGGELVDDNPNVTITEQFGWITIYSDGSQWYTIRHPETK